MSSNTSGLTWNLSKLYTGTKDPKLQEEAKRLEEIKGELAAWAGTIQTGELSPAELRDVFVLLENTIKISGRQVGYGHLLTAQDVRDRDAMSLGQAKEEQNRRTVADTLFVSLELQKLSEEAAQAYLEAPELEQYRHFIRKERRLAPYSLSEPEEKVLQKKNITGRDALVRFRMEHEARMELGQMPTDESRKASVNGLLSLRLHHDPAIRHEAMTRVFDAFAGEVETYGFIYGSVIKDHLVEAEMRGMKNALHAENIDNEVPDRVVENLVSRTRAHLPLAHDYFAWKKERLGLPTMRSCDLLAPVAKGPAPVIPWAKARGLVEASIRKFDSHYADLACSMIEEQRVDSEMRDGKRSGAFCYPIPENRCFVLTNHTEDISATYTLAHELGHAVHFDLAAEKQTTLQAWEVSKVLAETASEFNESILLDHWRDTAGDPDLVTRLLTFAVDRFFNVVNRQVMFTEFEMAAQEAVAAGEANPETLAAKYRELAREHYGPEVDLLENEGHGWSIVPHFVFNPFYCYSYALSQVVVLALYDRYQREGQEFVPAYKQLLAAGGSGTPSELLTVAGIDFESPDLVDAAYRVVGDLIGRLKEMAG